MPETAVEDDVPAAPAGAAAPEMLLTCIHPCSLKHPYGYAVTFRRGETLNAVHPCYPQASKSACFEMIAKGTIPLE